MKLTLRVVGSKLPPFVGEGSTIRLGRDPECEISLGDKFDSVSWRHTKVVLSAKGAVISDLESTNGTFLNDRRLQGTAMLKKGDHLRLGNGGPTLEVALIDLTPSASPASKRPELPETEPYVPQESAPATITNYFKQPKGIAIGIGAVAAILLAVLLGSVVVRGLLSTPTGTPIASNPTSPAGPLPPTNGGSGGPPVAVSGSLQDQALATLNKHCAKCHSPNAAKVRGGFGHIDSVAKMIEKEQLAPRKPEESKLYQRLVLPEDHEEFMPPTKEKNPLPKESIALIKNWIAGMEPGGKALATGPSPRPGPSVPVTGVEAEARAFLKRYCHDCHGVQMKDQVLRVFDREIMTKAPRAPKPPYITPGDPDKSAMWIEVALTKAMPTKDPKPTDAEKEALRKWILAGAPLTDTAEERPFVSELDVLQAIRHDQTQTPIANWPYYRYFTLTNLHNNNQEVSNDDMNLYRAALSKLINSLSRKALIVIPEAIDPNQTVYRIDTRKLDWDRDNLWGEIIRLYPYALRRDNDREDAVRRVAEDVKNNANTLIPSIRADWFIANASQPPLYHKLLDIPENARTLEQRLNVDIPLNFQRNELKRAGFNSSGVSRQNRLVERHDSRDGFYWKSYDFKKGSARLDLNAFPLGPLNLRGNQFTKSAFVHDGGEIIYSLPNGLQAYMLVTGEDVRINDGPTDVVDDPGALSGSTTIVNGISCMGCHKDGMRRGFQDMVRDGTALTGTELTKVLEIYPKPDEMKLLIDQDERRFLDAVQRTTSPFLPADAKAPEPITTLAGPYLKKDLSVKDVARELGLKDSEVLKTMIAGSQTLRALGLGPLAKGHAINRREGWEKVQEVAARPGLNAGCYSIYQQVAAELRLAEPMPLEKPGK